MNTVAIVPSAGQGVRFNSKVAKPLYLLNLKPIIVHTLLALQNSSFINQIILVINKSEEDLIKREIEKESLHKISAIVQGADTRYGSVKNGLTAISEKCDLVLIHDGVRPFIDEELIGRCVIEAERSGAAIAAVPVKSTIKEVSPDHEVRLTLRRNLLWEVQTPQVFRYDLILKAYKLEPKGEVTDDASLLERLGMRVKIVSGSYYNIKITTPEDLVFAQAILEKQR
jgi:2-C-methyl-D-erythritol 4-phosphate cytidylyltransferase